MAVICTPMQKVYIIILDTCMQWREKGTMRVVMYVECSDAYLQTKIVTEWLTEFFLACPAPYIVQHH